MIFPDVTLEEWLKKYPGLDIVKERCSVCRKKIITNKPFVDQHWVGLAAICECGFHGASSMFPRTQKSENLVSGLFGSIDEEFPPLHLI